MATKRFLLKDKEGNLVGIKVNTDKETFTIPVADVRVNRQRVESIEKAERMGWGSKYFKRSYSLWGYSYNTSMKG